uniref:SAP domain-containing protein n=1 Tax=Clastoptera arizonana TaxID=38151 RepID=A0A1B6CE62_9HEMI
MALYTLNISELRTELQSRGLDSKGNHATLVRRLNKAMEDEWGKVSENMDFVIEKETTKMDFDKEQFQHKLEELRSRCSKLSDCYRDVSCIEKKLEEILEHQNVLYKESTEKSNISVLNLYQRNFVTDMENVRNVMVTGLETLLEIKNKKN